MSQILEVSNTEVKIGESGKIITLPISAVRFPNPVVGEVVSLYREGDETLVVRSTSSSQSTRVVEGEIRVNKVMYVILTVFFAPLGVQRFMRRQVGLGIFMLLIGSWVTLGIWPIVDMIIALVKLASYPGEDYVFDSRGRWVK